MTIDSKYPGLPKPPTVPEWRGTPKREAYRLPDLCDRKVDIVSLAEAMQERAREVIRHTERSPTTLDYSKIRNFGIMLSPGKSSARRHSTSELLRTL